MTYCKQNLGRHLEGQGHSMTLQQNRVRPLTLLCEVGFYKLFTKMITILRRCVWRNILVATLKVKAIGWPCSKNVFGPLHCYLKFYFKTISQKWSPYWEAVSCANFGSLPYRSRLQHDHAAKTCLAHNFIIWSQILQIFDRNDHHIEMICNYLAHSLALWLPYCIILSSVT